MKTTKKMVINLRLDVRQLALAIIVFFACFFLAAYYATSVLTLKDTNAATDVAVVLNGSGYYINASSASEGTVQLDVASTPTGSMALAKDTLNVKSNAPEGYKVYVAMARDNSCSSNCNSLYKDKGTAAEASIAATSGTFDAPAVLGSNSWGFAIDKNATGAPENNFSTNYNTEVPDPTTLWAAMPLKGEDQLLQTVTTPDADEGIDVGVYYGVKANTALESGVYEGSIVYTVVGNAGSTPEITDISPSTTELLAGGETMTINTLWTITPAQAGTVNVTIGNKACTDVSLSQNTDNNLVISCVSPGQDAGKYNVVVSIPSYSKEATLVNGVEYVVNTANALSMQSAASWQAPSASATTSSLDYPAGYYSAGTYNVDLGNTTAANVLSGTTFSSNVAGLKQNGTMANYQAQYDSSKTAAQNTADAGLTWNADNSILSIAEGYHVAQQVNSQSGGRRISIGGTYSSTQGYTVNVSNYYTECHTLSLSSFILSSARIAYNASGSHGDATTGTILQSYNSGTCVLSLGKSCEWGYQKESSYSYYNYWIDYTVDIVL